MIHAEKANFPIVTMCKLLKVSTSGYYKWRNRGPSKRQLEDLFIVEDIQLIHNKSRGTYGSPRVHSELKDKGRNIGKNRVARLMRENSLSGAMKKRKRKTTNSNHNLRISENILDRKFAVEAPNAVWVTDITYLWCSEGWLYLAVVIDLYSRLVVGWSMSNEMPTSLVLAALHSAVGQRETSKGLIHHSDRGSQYASDDYRQALEGYGMISSMSRKGDCWDNAVAESFFGSMKQELIHRQSWGSRKELRFAVHEYIEVFYNRIRKHSTIGNVSPAQFEGNVA